MGRVRPMFVGDVARFMGKTSGIHFAVAFVMAVTAASAQINTASLAGQLKDPSGAVVPHAAITIVQQFTKIKSSATTNSDGRYAIEQLPPAAYSLTIEAAGFSKVETPEVVLHAGERVTQDFTLKVGDVSQVVPVAVTAGILETDSAEIS